MVERGEPFAVAQADTPHEIFHAMDIPVVSNQWWSAYISAKRLSGRYFSVLDELGYPPNRCNYCSLGLACSLANDPATAPWGGLPKPTVLVARLTCDCIQQVFSQWAEVAGDRFLPDGGARLAAVAARVVSAIRATAGKRSTARDRIALLTREMRDLIALLERKTGRRFDTGRSSRR